MAEFPIPELWKSASQLANADIAPDPSDRVYRRGALFSMFDGRVVPAEALAAYLAGNPGPRAISVSPGRLTVDGMEVPIDSEGRAILSYRGPSATHMALTAAAVVQADLQIQEGTEPALKPDVVKDKYVFYGYSAPGLFDLKPSPMTGDYPGVEIHATMLDNLLSGDFMRPVPVGATILLLLLLCIGAGPLRHGSDRRGPERAGLRGVHSPRARRSALPPTPWATGCRSWPWSWEP